MVKSSTPYFLVLNLSIAHLKTIVSIQISIQVLELKTQKLLQLAVATTQAVSMREALMQDPSLT